MVEIEETFEDVFNSRLMFVRALDAILLEGKGVYLDLTDTNITPSKVIIHKTGNLIRVTDATNGVGLENGNVVDMTFQ